MTPWTMNERAEWELAERRNQRNLARGRITGVNE